jgi:hypothetical protein
MSHQDHDGEDPEFFIMQMPPEVLLLQMAENALARYGARIHGINDDEREHAALVWVNQREAQWLRNFVAEHDDPERDGWPEEVCAFMHELRDIIDGGIHINKIADPPADPHLN